MVIIDITFVMSFEKCATFPNRLENLNFKIQIGLNKYNILIIVIPKYVLGYNNATATYF